MTSTNTCHDHTDPADTTTGDKPARHPAVEHLLRKLTKEPRHPFGIGILGRHFITLGQLMAKEVPDDPELSVALRHLLDARNAYASAYEDAHPAPSDYAIQAVRSLSDPHAGLVTFGIGHAVVELRAGNAVARTAWGPAGIRYLVLVPGSTVTIAADRPLGQALPYLVGQNLEYTPHIDRVAHTYSHNSRNMTPEVTAWRPTTDDLLAEDWYVVRNGE